MFSVETLFQRRSFVLWSLADPFPPDWQNTNFPYFSLSPFLRLQPLQQDFPHLHEFAHLKCVAVRCIGAEGGGWFGRTTVARLVEREREGAVRLQLLTEQCSVVRLSASLPGLVEGHVWKNGPRKANWVKWPRDVELWSKDQKNE